MSFDYAFAYEDRSAFHTSRWSLSGISTAADGNLKDGRLWMTTSSAGGTVTVELFKDPACGSSAKVATGTADVSGVDEAPAKCTLSEANSSGLSGELYFESYSADEPGGVEVLVLVVMDADLSVEYADLSNLPACDVARGMAACIEAATKKVLLLVSQLYRDQIGGFGAPEHRYRPAAARCQPDYRMLANPDQLQEAVTHWALMLAFGRSHDRAAETMYSELRDYHDRKRREAIASWNLTFNTDPDGDDDADRAKGASMVRVTRL